MTRLTAILFVVAALLIYLAPAAMAAPPERSVYIVVLHDDEPSPAAAAREIAAGVGGKVEFVYSHALKGFSIKIPPQAVAALERNPRVKYVEADQLRYAFGQTTPTGIRRIFAEENSDIGIDGADDYRVDVDVAVIDSGIDLDHPDLNTRAGVNCTLYDELGQCVDGGDDDFFHGTHVAGTIGALDNGFGVVGVAPGARLWPVKVLVNTGRGSTSWVIAGIDWITANAATIEVANMSLGGRDPRCGSAEREAIQRAVNAGVAFAVAAGNSDADASGFSPACLENEVLTVSALADFDGLPGGLAAPAPTCRTDQDDTLADFSNWGSVVDIAAPGVCILSTYPGGDYAILDGTSMASPHVAGALALLASADKPVIATEVYALYDQVKSAGNYDWYDDSGDGIMEPLLDVSIFTPKLVYTGSAPNTAPTVTITDPTDDSDFFSITPITFTASVIDEQELTSSLIWTSNIIEDPIGIGGSFSTTLSEGEHEITATATDSGGLSGSAIVTITVLPPTGGITLSVTGLTKGVNKYADLRWSGAVSANVIIKRDDIDGTKIITTANDGTYTDKVAKTTATATYQVCEADNMTVSSDEVTVSW
jgi:hypothetical protein